MSVDAGLFVGFAEPADSLTKCIRELESSGWSIEVFGEIILLLPGDVGDFDWQGLAPSRIEEAWDLLAEKEARDHQLGISMILENCGGEFLLETGRLTFSATINRQALSSGRSNVSWYLDKVLDPLSRVVSIESWVWREC